MKSVFFIFPSLRALRPCHSEPFALCHSEVAKRPKNLAQDKLREESPRCSGQAPRSNLWHPTLRLRSLFRAQARNPRSQFASATPCNRYGPRNDRMVCFTVLAITIFLIAGCAPAPANHPPSITSLKAEQDIVPPSGSCQIECIVSDNGDELSYEWQISGGAISGEGATAIWIAPDEPGEYIISVNVTGTDGNNTTQSITITVGENHPPQINSLRISDEWVVPLGNCTITCEASDPDGDKLSYEWSANGGNISDTGPVITWTAPEAIGIYTITVKVIDGMDGESASSLRINVAPNNPPTIENLIVTAEHKYLKEIDGGYKVGKGKSYEIECDASDADNDELLYEWSTSRGEISGEGPVVTWVAPNQGGIDVTIAVTVSDSNGGATTDSITFTVVSCTSCSF